MTSSANIQSVLFSCDYNAVRSPMAEALMKKHFGKKVYVQSAGVKHDIEIDGFAVTVCAEKGAELVKHRARSFQEMEEWGDNIEQFDLIIALSPAAQRTAQEYTRHAAIEVEYWPIMDPTGIGETRDTKLDAYRQARDQIEERILGRFGDK